AERPEVRRSHAREIEDEVVLPPTAPVSGAQLLSHGSPPHLCTVPPLRRPSMNQELCQPNLPQGPAALAGFRRVGAPGLSDRPRVLPAASPTTAGPPRPGARARVGFSGDRSVP